MITNIFNLAKIYGSWTEKGRRNFTEDEKDFFTEGTVVESTYGLSVCFLCKAGGKAYFPLSVKSHYALGDKIDVNTAQVIVLGRQGEEDIIRIE